jgi:hypothetical protein
MVKAQVANHLRNMDTAFNILRFRPKTVTNADVTGFNNSLEFVDARLRNLPDEETAAKLLPQAEPLTLGAPNQCESSYALSSSS